MRRGLVAVAVASRRKWESGGFTKMHRLQGFQRGPVISAPWIYRIVVVVEDSAFIHCVPTISTSALQ